VGSVQKIKSVFIVNFQVRSIDAVLYVLFLLAEALEQTSEHSRDQATFFPTVTSTHRVSLSRTSLAVCEDSSVVTSKTALNHGGCDSLKDIFLGGVVKKNLCKLEFVRLLRIVSDSTMSLVPREVDRESLFLRIHGVQNLLVDSSSWF